MNRSPQKRDAYESTVQTRTREAQQIDARSSARKRHIDKQIGNETSRASPECTTRERRRLLKRRESARARYRRLTPEQLGLPRHAPEEIEGGDPDENVAIMRAVFAGEGPAAVRDLICANAGAGLYVTGLAASVRQGVEQAKELVDSGDAAARVAAFVEATRRDWPFLRDRRVDAYGALRSLLDD